MTHAPARRPIASPGTVSPGRIAKLVSGAVASQAPVDNYAPATGQLIGPIPQSSEADVERAFADARQAQLAWAERPVRERAAIFRSVYDRMLDRKDEGLDLIQLETGKARLHAFEEILDGAGSTLYYARNARSLLRTRRRTGALPVATRAIESYLPKGVVATITPWNYPLALAMDVVPALLAGNSVVHKPATETALSSLWPRSLAIEAGLPPAVWQVVLGTPEVVGDPLLDNADYIGFTGSTPVGRGIAERAAKKLIGCSLELGGKNPMLVLDDVDLDRAVPAVVRACFASAGQLCVSIERIYVHDSRYDEFVAALAEQTRALRVGFAMDYSTDIGSLASQRQLDRVSAHVQQAVDEGATVVTGGRARPDLGPYFYEPTVLVDVPGSARLCHEETFGPVVSVSRFRTDAEAIALANDTEYGLNASVFSGSERHARAVAAGIRCGTVNINEGYAAAYASQGASMGGMKQSGLGRRHGPSGLLKYTEPQTVAAQRILGFDPAFGMSADQHTKLFTTSMKAMKALRIR